MPIRVPCRSRVGRRMNSRFCWARKYVGKLRSRPVEQGHRVVGHLVGEHARGAGDGDVGLDDGRHEAMVEPGRRGLNPAQAALPHDLVPRHGHFGVTAKNVGRRAVLGDAFLAGVDDFGVRRGGRDLGDVLRFDRVTEDDPGLRRRLRNGWRLGLAWHNIGCCRIAKL